MPWPQSEFHLPAFFPEMVKQDKSDATVQVPTDLSIASYTINFFILAFGLSASQEWWLIAGSWSEFSFSLEKMTSSLKGQKHILIMYWGSITFKTWTDEMGLLKMHLKHCSKGMSQVSHTQNEWR